MPKKSTKTYGDLKADLQTRGFQVIKRGDHVVFRHASRRPVILLPAYRLGQAVRPIHLMMIEKQLSDVGMLEEPFALHAPSKPARRRKPGTRPRRLAPTD